MMLSPFVKKMIIFLILFVLIYKVKIVFDKDIKKFIGWIKKRRKIKNMGDEKNGID